MDLVKLSWPDCPVLIYDVLVFELLAILSRLWLALGTSCEVDKDQEAEGVWDKFRDTEEELDS